jgi:hypothetical protein
MKIFLYLLLIIVIAFAVAPLLRPPDSSLQPVGPLPWQIEVLADGSTRVFGLTLGKDTLGDARVTLGDDMELAIVARGDETGSLEMYYGHYRVGPFGGKLVLVAAMDDSTVLALRQRAGKAKYLDSGARRYHLRKEDLVQAYDTLIQSITFIPAVNLDEEIARQRFGTPAETVQVNQHTRHLLYPAKGLDIMINDGHRDVLQYVAPRDFDRLRAPLREYQPQTPG